MFDDFMEELRRRQAEARGETPPEPGGRPDGEGPSGDPGDDDETARRMTSPPATRSRSGSRRHVARAAVADDRAGAARAARTTARKAGTWVGGSALGPHRCGHRAPHPVHLRDRPVDRRPVVCERQLRWRVLDPCRGPGGAVPRRSRGGAAGPARQPLDRRPPEPAAEAGAERPPDLHRPDQRRGAGERRRTRPRTRPRFGRPFGDQRTFVFESEDLPDLYAARPASPWSPSCVLLALGLRRRAVVAGLGDRPAGNPPGAVLARRLGRDHRPGLRPGHRLLPVRAAVPAPDPGGSSTALAHHGARAGLSRALSASRASRGGSGLRHAGSASTSRSSAASSSCRSRSATSSTSTSSPTAHAGS